MQSTIDKRYQESYNKSNIHTVCKNNRPLKMREQ